MVYIYIHIYIYIYIERERERERERMEYYSAIRKNEIVPAASNEKIDFEGIMLSEMSDRDRQILYAVTCVV